MSADETIGELEEINSELKIEWKITDFFCLPEEINTRYRSPVFYFADSSWYLEIYPNGRGKKSEGYVGIYLTKGDEGPPIYVTNTFYLQKADGTKEKFGNTSTDTFNKKDKGWGVTKTMLRSRLVEQKLQLVPFGVLTVVCSMILCGTLVAGDSLFRRLLNLSQSMRKVLTEIKRPDLVLNVQGVEFQAHKMILESRSSVFSAMFTHNMREEREGIVNIEDIKSDGFEPVLSYIYCGTVDDISDKNVFQVYEAAHKYDLKELELLCRVFIKNSLSKENVADIIKFSDIYKEAELNSEARKYFNENIKIIIKEDGWRTFFRENQELGMDLLADAIEKLG